MALVPISMAHVRKRSLLPEVSAETALLAYKIAYGGLILGAVLILASTLLAFWSDGEIKRHDDIRLSANEAETARAKESAAKADEAAAEANKRAAELELEAAKLKGQLAWRRLTKKKHDAIVAALRGTPSKVSVIHPDDTEASTFASEIAQTLKDAGWQVEQSTGFWTPKPPTGLFLSQTPDKEPHALAVALSNAGFDVVLVPGAPADELKLTVGAKPAPF